MAHLQLSERETTTSPELAVILDGRASHNGSQEVDGARGDSGSFDTAGNPAASLLAGLFPSSQVLLEPKVAL